MKIFWFFIAAILMTSLFAFVQGQDIDFMEMSLEDILDIEVSSVSKKVDRLQDVASSIYVITEEDIRRSGATRIQDVLYMVPGVFYADITYSYTSDAIRSELDEYTQTVLVLIDGVPLTSPLTAGMPNNVFDIPLQQIERIEVIKGPGGTIYGANANTGIISIFTKTGKAAEGFNVSLEGGFQDYVSPFVRYGRQISGKTYLSCYAKYMTTRGYDKTEAFAGEKITVQREDLPDTTIINKYPSVDTDGKEGVTAGLNLQSEFSDKLKSTTRIFYDNVKNKVYTSPITNPLALEQPLPYVVDENGIEFMVSERLDYTFNEKHSIFFHTYYRNHRLQRGIGCGVIGRSTIVDLEVQDNIRFGFNDLSLGGNYRIVGLNIEEAEHDISFSEMKTTEMLYAGFIQNKMSYKNLIDFTVGVKAETWTLVSHEPEFSPSVRLTLKPRKDLTVWSALSRSITIPGYIQNKMELRMAEIPYITPEMALFLAYMLGLTGEEADKFVAENTTSPLFLPGTDKCYVAVVSRDDVKPIEYFTYELGLRTHIVPQVVFDFSAFYTRYNNAITTDNDFMAKGPTPSKISESYTILPIYYSNTYKGIFYGGEFIARINPTKNLKMEISYTLFKEDIEALPIPGRGEETYNIDIMVKEDPLTPEHILRIRSYFDIPMAGVSFNLNATLLSRYDRGPAYNYVLQSPESEDLGIIGVKTDSPKGHLELDFLVEKTLFNNRIALKIWGKNILADPYVEDFSEYVGAGYPHTVHRTFGGGISFRY